MLIHEIFLVVIGFLFGICATNSYHGIKKEYRYYNGLRRKQKHMDTYSDVLINRLENLTDEEFDKLLIDSGIEDCPLVSDEDK